MAWKRTSETLLHQFSAEVYTTATMTVCGKNYPGFNFKAVAICRECITVGRLLDYKPGQNGVSCGGWAGSIFLAALVYVLRAP